MFFVQMVSGLPSTNIAASSLPLVVKVLGFVVSWAGSIYFLWVRKPPKTLTDLPFFEQTQRISIIVTSIFLMLTWGALGTPHSLGPLKILAIVLTAVGILVYFVIVAWIAKKERAQTVVVTASPVAMLVCFLIYTASISCGLTAAQFTAPTGATIVGQSAATFQNSDNAKIVGAPAVNQSDQVASASGRRAQRRVGRDK